MIWSSFLAGQGPEDESEGEVCAGSMNRGLREEWISSRSIDSETSQVFQIKRSLATPFLCFGALSIGWALTEIGVTSECQTRDPLIGPERSWLNP